MAINNNCQNCGGELKYDATSGELKCNKCLSIVDIPEQTKVLERRKLSSSSTIKTSKTKHIQFHCDTCGRNHISPTENELISCPSCGDNKLIRTLNIEYIPDGIIPFTLDKENALKCFKNWIKKRKFTPMNLKEKAKALNFSGLYQPAYIYNFDCETEYSGIGIKQITTYSYNPTTKQSTPVTRYQREHFSGTREDNYRNYLDSANTNFSTEILNKIGNFNYKNICVYRPEFLYGWTGSEVTIPLEKSVIRTKNTITYNIKSNVQLQYGFDRIENFICQTNFINNEFNYIYLPIWSCNYKYKDKTYNFYINGVTGKTHGKAPKSKGKITALVLSILGIVGIMAYLLIKYIL